MLEDKASTCKTYCLTDTLMIALASSNDKKSVIEFEKI